MKIKDTSDDFVIKKKAMLNSFYEPLAIIGMGCRFPGGGSRPDRFWDNLMKGKDCIVDVPNGRWDVKRFYSEDREMPGKMHVKSGGFLQEKIEEFDALFFGISPREANALDPQQRVLLEVSWEAFEDAGIDPHSLSGTSTGVFVGGFMLDNKVTQLNPLNRHTIASDTAVGMTLTMLSNRLSYFYNFKGPSLSIDTACSSSLVALDQACVSIWSGESDMALVGGVNIMHRPEMFIAMCKGGFLAPDGRSKAFDARADGYGRGEGAGIVLIKPLAKAEEDGDFIYAAIKATGSNQDGRTDGITAPNPESQQELIIKVCKKAAVSLSDIAYFEAHGTGTPVGDPIEISAIGGTVGKARQAGNKCLVGSVKGNIGHLEAASGIAALIKSALCLHHETAPPQANLENLNENIPFDALNIRIPKSAESIQKSGEKIFSGINSFGYGGTNACAILENYITAQKNQSQDVQKIEHLAYVLPLSAKGKPALVDVAKNYLTYLELHPETRISDLCFSAGAKKAHLSHRLAIQAKSIDELKKKLQGYIEGTLTEVLPEGQVNENRNKLVFVFTGMGPQWWKMGRELMESEPVFYNSLKRSDLILKNFSGWSILEEMLAPEESSRISETQFAQPSNFVIQVALVDLWQSWGIEPSAIVGHSVGEVMSAYISGVLTLEQAMLVSYERSRIQKKAANQGGMLAVGMSEEDSLKVIAPYNGKVSIAAINAPTAITLAGDEGALDEIAEMLEAEGAFNRRLQVEVAYHSPTMDPLLDEIRSCLSDLNTMQAVLPCYSTVTGKRVVNGAFNADYWCRNVRDSVYFYKSIEQMIEDGHRDFIEIGPHPVLSSSIKECFAENSVEGFLVASLNRKLPEQDTIKNAVAELYCRGYKLNWQALSSDFYIQNEATFECEKLKPKFLRLPTYPWQKEVYWNDAQVSWKDRVGEKIDLITLGAKQDGPGQSWVSFVNSEIFCHLRDHKVEGLTILAGATYVEAALSAYNSLYDEDACLISGLRFHNAMVIDEHAEPMMQTEYRETDKTFSIYGYDIHDKNRLTLHANGVVEKLVVQNSDAISIEDIKSRCLQSIKQSDIYQELDARGLQYGPYFQRIRTLWRRDNEVLARIQAHERINEALSAYQLHPTILDACFQSLISAMPVNLDCAKQVYVPSTIEQIRHYQKVTCAEVYCHGILEAIGSKSIRGNITICDEEGSVLIEIIGLRCQALRSETRGLIDNMDDWTYQACWREQEAREVLEYDEAKKNHFLFIHDDALGHELRNAFSEKSPAQVHTVYSRKTEGSASVSKHSEQAMSSYFIDPSAPSYLRNIIEKAGSKDVCLNYAWAATRHDNDPIHLKETQYLANFLRQVNALASHFSIRVQIYTLGAVRASEADKVSGFYQSPVIGLARTAATEMPDFHCCVIDLDEDNLPQSAFQAFAESQLNIMEHELAYRGASRYVSRLEKRPLAKMYKAQQTTLAKQEAMVWSQQGISSHVELQMQKNIRRSPEENEVELVIQSAVHSSSTKQLHARREVFAKVVSIGAAVKQFDLGQEILAVYDGPLTNYITIAADQLIHVNKPSALSSGGVPILTAYLLTQSALYEIAQVESLNSLLLLGADTAPGQVFNNVAKHLGIPCSRVYHEPSSLQSSNGGYLARSSTLQGTLLNDLTLQTNATSFDLVINIGVNISCLKEDQLLSAFGKWIDIDLEENFASYESSNAPELSASKMYTRLQIDSVLPCIFNAVSGTFVEKLKHIQTLIQSTCEETLRFKLISIEDIANGVTTHLPGIVRLGEDGAADVVNKSCASVTIRPNVSYLITGGFGGFGLKMAHWLSEQGAKHLILVSRSGGRTPSAQAALHQLRQAGVRVHVAAVDIANRAQVSALITEVAEIMPVLGGIFHAAGVLDDKEMMEIDDVSFEKVMKPKALGAWHLHELTQGLDLDCFVLFSSISALIGNRNQANYVAANLFLDGLAQYRHACGLAANSINWGVLADVGMAANDPAVIDHLENIGIHVFTANQALEVFSYLLQAPVPQLGIFKVDWQRWKQFEAVSKSLRFSELVSSDSDEDDNASWLDRLQRNETESKVLLLDTLGGMLANILKLSPEQLDVETPINNFGLASLMAMDLQMKIRGEFKVDMSILELMKGSSLQKLCEVIAGKVVEGGISESEDSAFEEENSTETFDLIESNLSNQDERVNLFGIDDIDALSEEELDDLLKLEVSQI